MHPLPHTFIVQIDDNNVFGSSLQDFHQSVLYFTRRLACGFFVPSSCVCLLAMRSASAAPRCVQLFSQLNHTALSQSTPSPSLIIHVSTEHTTTASLSHSLPQPSNSPRYLAPSRQGMEPTPSSEMFPLERGSSCWQTAVCAASDQRFTIHDSRFSIHDFPVADCRISISGMEYTEETGAAIVRRRREWI